jgi:ribosomal protein L22
MSDEKDEKLAGEGVEPEATDVPEPPKRRRRRKKADAAHGEAAEQAKAGDEPAGEGSDPPEGSDPSGSDPKAGEGSDPPKRRRGSAETTTTAKRDAVPAPRDAAGRVTVRAQAKYVRCAPRKARLVVDHIRGKSVEDARAILATTPRAAARDVLKLLDSAIANAENNHELVADELKIGKVYVDEGPTLKRFRPRAQGRATRIRKRTSHMTILLTTKEDA